MQKQITLALTVVIAVLLGGSLSQNHVWAEQAATDPSPTAAPTSSQTDLDCGSSPTSCTSSHVVLGGGTIKSNGYELNGSGWLCSDTGEYCAEEGSSIRFPDEHLVKGPAKGTYKGK